jgi:hypothetical protein
MTPERMAALVAWWVRRYTRDLPPHLAERRRGEIDADLHDHIAHERARGTSDRRIALHIAARMLRGLAADASWRGQMTSNPARRSVVRVGLVTGLVLLVPLVAMQVGDGVDWSPADFVVAGVFLGGAGALLELAVRKPRTLVYRAGAAAVGVAAIVLGEGDDAPGLVLFGCLLILGAVAVTVRAAWRGD